MSGEDIAAGAPYALHLLAKVGYRAPLAYIQTGDWHDETVAVAVDDGCTMAVVPVVAPTDLLIPWQVWERARTRSGYRVTVTDDAFALPDRWQYPRPQLIERFDWRSVVAKVTKVTENADQELARELCLGHGLLTRLARALAVPQHGGLRLRRGSDQGGAVLVETKNRHGAAWPVPPFGLIMPMLV